MRVPSIRAPDTSTGGQHRGLRYGAQTFGYNKAVKTRNRFHRSESYGEGSLRYGDQMESGACASYRKLFQSKEEE
jgi:hypothetical protein